ncbi:MAG: RimK family protein [Acidobacteriota bacterium]|nr:MAG: RimK family protein [Acidobacteriota bacterium]
MRKTLLVVENPANWPLQITGVEVVAARSYLADERFSKMRRAFIINLCRSYRYQSVGYYVSLLAEARGHRPIPTTTTIQDLKSTAISRVVSGDLDRLIERSLAPIKSNEFVLSVYFGQNVAKRYERLSQNLFRLFDAPLMRVTFRKEEEEWEIRSITAIAASEIPEAHRPYVIQFAEEFLTRNRRASSRRTVARYDLAILWDPKQPLMTASDERAIRRFTRAAEALDMSVEIITRDDYGRIAEFDALFIRDTTNVHHYTYRFARRASAEGLVVIDDPESILRCTNKVYLAELLKRHRIPIPKTIVINSSNTEEIATELGFPCILKQPDSSFSQGVSKVSTREELKTSLEQLLDKSELVVAQEYMPTPFDWRVGIIDGEPLYVCRYHMARKHWQIIRNTTSGKSESGRVDTMAVSDAPVQVVRTAVKAANLIGKGFYGVDLKQIGKKVVVIEVNDNPSIDAGYEDAVLKEQLYSKLMSVFVQRLDRIKRQRNV